MPASQLQNVIRRMCLLMGARGPVGLDDATLLERFAIQRDEAAFEVLVWRHGTMVLNVCQRVLKQAQDVEDAFQATFITLVKKSGSISRRESIGSWLYKVAYRVALEARGSTKRQPSQPPTFSEISAPDTTEDVMWRDLRPVLDAEINQLPAKYRAPFVLCYLQGKTNVEAAQELGCPRGTVLSRLAWARARLRTRLTRRGVALSSAILGAGMFQNVASAALSEALVSSTVKASAGIVSGKVLAASCAPAKVLVLAESVVRNMFMYKLKMATMLLTGFVVTTVAAGLVVHQSLSAQQSSLATAKAAQAVEVKQLTQQTDQDGEQLPAGAVSRLGRLRLRHGGEVSAVAYAPNGIMMASAGTRSLKLWDSATGRMLRELGGFGYDGSRSIAFSPDSRLLAAGGNDWTVRIWDVETGRQLHLLRAHRFGRLGSMCPIQVAFTPDGGSLVSAGHECVIQIWDVVTGKELLSLRPTAQPRKPGEREEAVTALAVSPDGKTIAVADSGQKISVWDLSGGQPPVVIPARLVFVADLKFSPDGKTLAWSGFSASKEKPREDICLWDLADNRLRLQLPGHQSGRTNGIAFSPNGKQLASCGSDRTVKIWDPTTGKLVRALAGHSGWTSATAFSPDGGTVASASSDGSIRLWNAETGQERLPPAPEGQLDQIMSVSVSPDGQSVLTGSKDCKVRAWDLTSGRLRRSVDLKVDYLETIAFSTDGTIAAGGHQSTVEAWDVGSGQRLWSKDEFLARDTEFQFKNPETASVVFSRDGKRLASATVDRADRWHNRTVVRVWNTATGKLLAQLNRPTRMAAPPALNPSGETITLNEQIVEGEKTLSDMTMRVFKIEAGRLVREFKAPNIYANGLTLTHDGKWLVTASGPYLGFWDADGKLQFTLGGTTAGANFGLLAVSQDGRHIAAASNHEIEIVQVWDIASGRLTHEFPVCAKSLQFTPDSKKFVTGLEDGTTLVWDLNLPTARFAPKELARNEIENRWLRQAYGLDSSQGNRGIYARTQALVEGGDATVAYLEQQLLDPDLPKRDEELARRLAAPFADPKRDVRERAIRELASWGDYVWLAVNQAADSPASPELVRGIEETLLENLKYRRSSHGSIDVLKMIATPRARQLLARLAQGPEDTHEQKNRKLMAKYTLDDLDQRRLRRSE